MRAYEAALEEASFDEVERSFLIDGFTNGFDIGYKGPNSRQSRAKNIPFTPGVGDKVDMWNKIMKDVEAGWVAGPFNDIPFDNSYSVSHRISPQGRGEYLTNIPLIIQIR